MRFPSLLAVAPLLLPLSPAMAQIQPVRIMNAGPISATGLYLAPIGTAGWGANLLAGLVLQPGGLMSVQLGDGGGCRFNLRLVLRDGREALRHDVDLCVPPAAPGPATGSPPPEAARGRP